MLGKSINKTPCENYPFEDYHLKSGIAISILDLMTSGRKRWEVGLQVLPASLEPRLGEVSEDYGLIDGNTETTPLWLK